jgi:hypothetical protein
VKVALFFHLLGAFVLVAGVVVAGVAHAAARRRRRPDEIACGVRKSGSRREVVFVQQSAESISPLDVV